MLTFELRAPTITTFNAGLKIVSQSAVDFNATKIKNVGTPLSARHVVDNPSDTEDTNDHVVTKGYVDTQLDLEPVVTTIDCTGFSNPSSDFTIDGGPYNDVIGVLNFLHPASEKETGAVARLYAVSYSGTEVTGIDVAAGASKSYISVYVDPDDSTTPQLESVLQDINFAPITGDASLVPNRATMEFIVNGNSWQWVRTTPIT